MSERVVKMTMIDNARSLLVLEKLLERDRFFDAESAKRLGLIDKVLEHPITDLKSEEEKRMSNAKN